VSTEKDIGSNLIVDAASRSGGGLASAACLQQEKLKMRRDDLMKPDLLCKVLVLGSALTVGALLMMVIAAVLHGGAS
jgi:hypothetical protein